MSPSHRTPIVFALAMCAAALFLSSGSPAKDDWLPIDPADLALKDNPASPGAHAMILYRESSIDAKTSTLSDYFRVKIFTEEGKNPATSRFPSIRARNRFATSAQEPSNPTARSS